MPVSVISDKSWIAINFSPTSISWTTMQRRVSREIRVMNRLLCICLFTAAILTNLSAAEPVFSGPQPGEKTTPFKVIVLNGADAGREREVMAGNAEATALVFLHTLE